MRLLLAEGPRLPSLFSSQHQIGIIVVGGIEEPMTHLRQRSPGGRPVTYLTVGVRGEEAARTVEGARLLAAAGGVTFGSLVMEALAQYMDRAVQETRQTAAELNGHE